MENDITDQKDFFSYLYSQNYVKQQMGKEVVSVKMHFIKQICKKNKQQN